MSNFKAKAKRPDSNKWEEVEMLDNYFGSHVYGVRFPDGKVIKESKCEVKTEMGTHIGDERMKKLTEGEETTFIILASKENHKTIDGFLTKSTSYKAIKLDDEELFDEDEEVMGNCLRYIFQNLIKTLLKNNKN